MDPETTQPGGQRLGPRCDGECPTWPLAPRPSHKSINFHGQDGLVRTAEVKTKNSILLRPISKLCLLEESK